MFCRNCNSKIENTFIDLGHSPPSNAYLTTEDLQKKELYFPLKIGVCKKCWLVQTKDFIKADELFTKDYAYLSSASKSWLEHCKNFVNYSIKKFNLQSSSFVIEVAANDGYLLQYYKSKNIKCLGIEPTQYAADLAKSKGIEIISEFCNLETAKRISNQKGKADLVIGNNVYAHVPDIKDFTLSLKELIKENGIISLEFPHLMRLIQKIQFDTIYHEHFSYLSLTTVNLIFEEADLKIFDVQELVTHGGSLRILASTKNSFHEKNPSVEKMLNDEKSFGITNLTIYENFQEQANKVKNNLIKLLVDLKNKNKKVMAYGAAAKGNTLLNYAGIKKDLISYVFDKAESKQGKYMPGSHIPILDPKEIFNKNPDYLLILPWNISKEIIESLNELRETGTKFIICIPEINII
nr:class I SAM-dependent methyltransferase [Prochlorococcus marinus]